MNLKEFQEWAIKQVSVGNPETNSYKGQCVSLIQQYLYRVFNIPYRPRGNAIDWQNLNISEFKKISPNEKLEKGDILVYGSNYGNGYGHMGIIDYNMRFLDQNGIKKLKISSTNLPFKGYICILRPNDKTKLEVDIQITDEIIKDVIQGKYGNGNERIERLTKAGYNAKEIQNLVNQKLGFKTNINLKSNKIIAKEIIKGLWGNGNERKERLTQAGYNYNVIQDIVNKLV